MKPTLEAVHVNRPLTEISIAYMQEQTNFIADRVFPRIPVAKQSDRYFVYSKADWLRTDAQVRGPATESPGSGFDIDNTPTYYAPVYALHKDVDDQTRANADEPLNLDRDATLYVTEQLLIKRDMVWAGSYFTTGKWGLDLQGVAAAPGANQFLQWDQAASTPIEDITGQAIAIAKNTGRRPNTLVLTPDVFNTLKQHADLIDRVKYTSGQSLTTAVLANLFEVERVLVAWAVRNTAAEGAAASMSFAVGSKGALLVYSNPNPSILQPSGGYTFSWTGYLGAEAMGARIKRFRMEELAADRVEGEMAFDMKLVGADLGTFFYDAIA